MTKKDDPFKSWYPMYPARFKKKTLHLTLIQRAIYRELIDFYMETRSPIPNSDIALARIVGISPAEFAPHSDIIRAFFKVKKDALFHPTCEAILEDQKNLYEKRKKSAKKAVNSRWQKAKENQGDLYATYKKSIRRDTTKHNITEEERKKTPNGVKERKPPPSQDTDSFRQVFEEGSAIFPQLASRRSLAITQWLEAGADPDRDILPELRRAAGRNVSSWNYFTQPVMDSVSARKNPLPQGKTAIQHQGKPHGKSKSDRAKAAVLEGLGLAPEA